MVAARRLTLVYLTSDRIDTLVENDDTKPVNKFIKKNRTGHFCLLKINGMLLCFISFR